MKLLHIYIIRCSLLVAMLFTVSWTRTWAAEAMAYVVLSSDYASLTFYFDENQNSHSEGTVILVDEMLRTQQLMMNRGSITMVTIDASFANYGPTSTASWFNSMSQLRTLDLSNLTMTNVTNTDEMFSGCSSLTTITVNDTWPAQNGAEGTVTPGGSGSSVSGSNMFNGCTSLVGGAGTPYDASHVDYTYAHIDGGDSNPGYFTAATGNAEPYAVLSDNNTVLTFYYDDQKNTRNGMDIGPFTLYFNNADNTHRVTGRPWESNASTITTVIFDESLANYTQLTDMLAWFTDFTKLTTIQGLNYLNTEKVTDMSGLFWGCSSLRTLDLSTFNTSNVTSMWSMFDDCTSLTSLNISTFKTSKVTDMRGMFYGCSSLTTLNLSHFDTSNVVYFNSMFRNCSNLTSVNVGSFNTGNAEVIQVMFGYCPKLTTLNLSSFNTAKVTNMVSLFRGCTSLETILVGPDWVVSNTGASGGTTDIGENMFYGCTSLKGGKGTVYDDTHTGSEYARIDNAPDTPGYFTAMKAVSVTASFPFSEGTEGQNAVFSHPDYFLSSQVTHGSNLSIEGNRTCAETQETLFTPVESHTDNLTDDDAVTFLISTKAGVTFTPTKVSFKANRFGTDMGTIDAYWLCPDNTTIELEKGIRPERDNTGINTVKSCDITGMTHGEGECGLKLFLYDYAPAKHIGLADIIIEGTLSGEGVVATEAYAAFNNDSTVLTFYYDSQKETRNGMSVGPFNAYERTRRPWEDYIGQITKAVFDQSFDQCTTLTSTEYWFTFMDHLETIEHIEYLHTDNVESMAAMFDSCHVLRDLDVSHFVTAKVKNMECMFNRCESLTSLNLSNFNTSVCTNMRGMFCDCKQLTRLDITNFDTSKNTNAEYMFGYCPNLTSLDLSHFSTESVTNMSRMFAGSSALTSLDLGGFNTANVTDMSFMFNQCSSLTTLNVSGFNTANVTSMDAMFSGCEKLSSLDVSKFNTEKVTDMKFMYNHCASLTNLNVSSFNTANVTDMTAMFQSCGKLLSLDLSSFNTANVTSMTNMFYANSSLASIQAGNAVIPDSIYAQIHNPNLLLYVNEASQAPQSVKNVVVLDAAEQIVLTDMAQGNNNFYCPKQFTAKSISYTRNFKQTTQVGVSRGWETIALPFTVQTITHEKNGTLTPFGVEGGKPFWLKELTGNGLVSARHMDANVPYLISMPNNSIYPDDYNQAGNVTFSATNAVIPVTESRETSGNNRTLIPTMMSVAQSPDIYVINRDTTYQNNPQGSIFVADYREVRPFEAYAKHVGGAHYFSLSDIPQLDVTGIETIELKQWNGEQWWTLDGRKLNGRPSKKGIYIRNGKKVVVDATF